MNLLKCKILNDEVFRKRASIIIEIIFWITVAILISKAVLLRPLKDLDEMWNYNFSKNILEGRLPYKDFNIITMPLVPYIGALFLIVFGNEMLSMRIFAIISTFFILYVFCKILKLIKIDKNLSKILIVILLYIYKNSFRVDYNFFSLLILLCIMYIEIKNIEYLHKKNSKIDILLGILAGLCVCSKQTTGLFITIVTIFYQIIFIEGKETFKVFIRKTIDRIIGFSIVIGILCLYFTIFNLWRDFIDYAILGIKKFSNTSEYTNLFQNKKLEIKLLSVVIPVYLVCNLIMILVHKISKREIDVINVVLLAYSFASMVVVYPISDGIHFLVGCLPSIIGITYIICTKFIKSKKRWIFIETVAEVMTIFLIVCAVLNVNDLCRIFKYTSKYKQINHFKYILDSKYSRVAEVDEYIKSQEKPVYILDSRAVLYTIPIDQYNKDFDMFNKGNLGAKGEEGIIEQIKNMNNVQILVLNKYNKLNWQTPLKVIKYIRNDLNKVGNVGIFEVYEK